MRFFAFTAGFFRQNAAESSTRLVGVISFITGCCLAVYMVHEGKTSATELTVLGMLFTYGCVALGLRKAASEIETVTSVVAVPSGDLKP